MIDAGSRPEPKARAVVLVVLDSVGIGGAPDAASFGDEGSATLPHVAKAVGGLDLPHLQRLGLGRVATIAGVEPADRPDGAFGAMTERSPGKDTTTGHWEIAGVILERAFPTYPEGFPAEVIDEFERRIGRPVLGNVAASGTEIIDRLGEEHLETGKPIVYTSADSVFQIAAHVEVIPLEQLYSMCRAARELLRDEHEVGRVIARPFEGRPGAFARTPDRHDFSVLPPRHTVLDEISGAGLEVCAVGKVADIFGGRGVTSSRPTRSNDEGVDAIVKATRSIGSGLVFANLVDFDQSYGHRNDPRGYADSLQEFDRRLPEIRGALGRRDFLMLTADHGNDPTTSSTDHSRERVPLLVCGEEVRADLDLEVRDTFADAGTTAADLLGVATATPGRSFAAGLTSRPAT
ncbi:MAG: phosphopentomutase [Actinomycetota bacterium]|nr:phosphopentomutase [Actinomycetota bacterium]